MTRITVRAGAAFVCGIAAGALLEGNIAVAVPICIISAAAVVLFKGRVRLFCAFLGIGCALFTAAWQNASFTERYGGSTITLDCTVCETSGVSPQLLVCSAVYPNGREGKIGIYLKNDAGFSPSDRFTVCGKAFVPSVNRTYYTSKSVFLLMFYPKTENVEPGTGIRAASAALRRRIIGSIGGSRTTDSEELLTGMLFGSRFAQLSVSAENNIRNAGVGHIAAVSGLHLSAVVALFSIIFGKGRRSRFIASAVSGLAVCLMADFSLSVLRAYIMLLIITAAPLFHRRDDPLTALFAMVIAVGAVSPLSVTSASFVLSCGGVFAAAVLPPRVCRVISEHIKEKKALERPPSLSPALQTLAVMGCISAVMMPLSAVYFERISLASPLANLLLSPVVTAVVSVGAAGCILFVIFPPAGYVCFVLCRILCGVILKICALISENVPTLPSPPVFAAAAGIAVCAAAAVFTHDRRALLCTIFSVSSMVLITHSVYLLAAPDRVETQEGVNAAMFITRECRIFICGENGKPRPFDTADVVVCPGRQTDFIHEEYPDSLVINSDEPGEYDISGVKVIVGKDMVYAGNGQAEVCVMT